jgi:hypothetical protein
MSEVEGSEGRLLADRYRLEEVLGRGGMGTVWRAVDETLGRPVAVKELRLTGDVDDTEKQRMITRTLREAKATARIRNTGAITVYDVVREDDRPWIVMELIEGRSLADVIRDDGPVSPRRAAEIGLVVLDVLKAAHAEGILHRDVKPSNVLLAGDGPGGRVVLGDFGIAQIDGDPSVTSTGMLVGAPSYISPERARGQKPGPPADLWSLGALLYAAVEGHPPYDKSTAIATLTAVMTEPVGPMPNAGPLAGAINGLLVKDPGKRLDEAGARRMLNAVLYAPEKPEASETSETPEAPAATRTMALPAAPSDDRPALPATPSRAPAEPSTAPAGSRDAGPGVGSAAAGGLDAARAREALRALRNAAASPARGTPSRAAAGRAPEHGTPAGSAVPARAPLTDVLPRRTLMLIVAVVVLVLAGTAIGVAVARSGGGSKGGGAPAATTGPARADGKDTGDDTAAARTPSAPASASAKPSSAAASRSAGTGDAVPAGWYLYHDKLNGFSIALPKGWKRVGNNGYGSGSLLKGPGDTSLLVDWTDQPGKSALGAWKTSSAAARGTMKGYRLLRLADVDYRGYDAADWEYERLLAGKPVHVLNRGMVTDPHHGYAIMFTTPKGQWTSDANRQALKTFFATFKPAK